MLFLVCLLHSNMDLHLVSQDQARFPPVDPQCDFRRYCSKNVKVLLHVREGGHTHALEVDILSSSLPPHLPTHVRATCKFWWDCYPPRHRFGRYTAAWALRVYAPAFSVRGCTGGILCCFLFVYSIATWIYTLYPKIKQNSLR
jgi:hypothetical protein